MNQPAFHAQLAMLVTPGRKQKWLGILTETFQMTHFKDWQLKVIQAVYNRRNAVVIQPTGSGKSLCFQFPPAILGKMSIVIVPTISIQKDQTASLLSKGICVTYLGCAQRDKRVQEQIMNGMFRIVYVTPESFYDYHGKPIPLFSKLAESDKIGVIAVDEAHLMFSWKSFR